jgi:Skp family chaperone for outer membrane proteins
MLPRLFKEVAMVMVRAVLACLFVGCFGIGTALAQQPAATPPAALPTTLSVMVVDVQTLAQNSKSAKMVRQQIEGKRAEYQKELTHEDDLQSKRQALERSNAEALKQIDDVVKKIIYDIAKDRKINLVLQRSELLLYDPAFDVTDQILQKLDEQLPTLTVNFVAPVAVAAPEQSAPGAPKTPAAPPKKK